MNAGILYGSPMTSLPASEGVSQTDPGRRFSISRLVRRIHMYSGLFLAPWMVMYALSTMVMTHRQTVQSFYNSKNPAMVTERELDYTRSFPSTATREQIADQILLDIGLDGTHSVSGGRNNQPLVINRQHALAPRRITFDAAAGKIKIERQEFRTPAFLERMHRRRGYKEPYTLEDTWGLSVDVAVVAMIFWSLSGIWMWWEIKTTRLWGAVSLIGGLGLFTLFLFLI
jgi:hypothetical protein